jgi:hypothetical protein
MKKLLLVGPMLMWAASAAAQNGGGTPDQCPAEASPAIAQTDVATVQRDTDSGSAVIQLSVTASLPNGGAPAYAFSSSDGTITGNGATATWTVTGAGPFMADVAVTAPDTGCTSHAVFTYHMEESPSQ